jgi:hypothetical protein
VPRTQKLGGWRRAVAAATAVSLIRNSGVSGS